MSHSNILDNYQEELDDNWDDLLDNNDDLDDVLRTSVYSNQSTSSASSSPTKPLASREHARLNINGSPKKKPYQSISLADFETAMSNMAVTDGPGKQKPTLNKQYLEQDILQNSGTFKFSDLRGSPRGKEKHFISDDHDDSELEDGLEFPEDFDIGGKKLASYKQEGNFFTPEFVKDIHYNATLDMLPSNSSFSSGINGSSSVSAYSESDTEATDFNNVLEIENDDFEKLLEIRLRKARYQAELEEMEFYAAQKKRNTPTKSNISGNDLMNLPDDTFIYGAPGAEEDQEFFEDFEDFKDIIPAARDVHRSVVFNASQTQLPNSMKGLYKLQSESDFNLHRPKNSSPPRMQNKLSSKKSMPVMRAPSILVRPPTVKKTASTQNLSRNKPVFKRNGKRKILMQPTKRQQYGIGDELDSINDLCVDFNQERRAVNENYNMYNTIKGTFNPKTLARNNVDLSVYCESPGPEYNATLKSKGTLKKKKPKRKKMGLIKHLNAPQKQYDIEGFNGNKMTFNPLTYKWEGNEVDLKRFASIKQPKQPALITFLSKKNYHHGSGTRKQLNTKNKGMKLSSEDDSDFEELSVNGLQVEGSMYFNPRKLCWISLKAENDLDKDPFQDIRDLEVNNQAILESQKAQVRNFSLINTPSNNFVSEFAVGEEFDISRHTIERYFQEEERWIKKVKNWFQPGEELLDREYAYEIRNMVMGNTTQ